MPPSLPQETADSTHPQAPPTLPSPPVDAPPPPPLPSPPLAPPLPPLAILPPELPPVDVALAPPTEGLPPELAVAPPPSPLDAPPPVNAPPLAPPGALPPVPLLDADSSVDSPHARTPMTHPTKVVTQSAFILAMVAFAADATWHVPTLPWPRGESAGLPCALWSAPPHPPRHPSTTDGCARSAKHHRRTPSNLQITNLAQSGFRATL